MQPLLFDGEGESVYAEEHCLADLFPEIIRLIGELSECIDRGVYRWREAYWDDELAYQTFSPADLDCDADDDLSRQELAGYPVGITEAATAIFYGLRPAQQYHEDYGHHKSLAAAIRYYSNGCSLESVSDSMVFAMAGVIEAWLAREGLIRWLDDSLALMDKDFCPFKHMGGDGERLLDWHEVHDPTFAALHRGEMPDVADWAIFDSDCFQEWASSYREKWSSHEAEEREYATRCLGKAEQLLESAKTSGALVLAATIQERAEGLTERNRENGRKGGRPYNKRSWLDSRASK